MAKQFAIKFRKSSSLIVLTKDKVQQVDKKVDFRVLLFDRHEKSSFMPNSSVFPGGVCEWTDENPIWRNHFAKLGVTKRQLKPVIQLKGAVPNIFKNDNPDVLEREISLRITAIRETFEELGIILCRDRKSLNSPYNKGYGNFKEDFDRKHWQSLVHNDASKFFNLCEELDIVPDLWSLYEWSNWFTPSTFKKRFDTAFFMVALQDIPDVIPEQNEVKDFAWKTPADYIESHFSKEIWLPPPQVYELSRLLNFTNLEQVKHFAQQRSTEDDFYPKNPDAFDTLIKIDKNVKEFRQGVKKLHRIEFYNSHYVVVRQNFTPVCGHIKPKMTNPNNYD